MFAKETYMQRRALLKKNLGSGVLLFLGNDECGLNYEDNTFRYRMDGIAAYATRKMRTCRRKKSDAVC